MSWAVLLAYAAGVVVELELVAFACVFVGGCEVRLQFTDT